MIFRLYACLMCKASMTRPRAWIPDGDFVKAPVCEKCFNKILEKRKNG